MRIFLPNAATSLAGTRPAEEARPRALSLAAIGVAESRRL